MLSVPSGVAAIVHERGFGGSNVLPSTIMPNWPCSALKPPLNAATSAPRAASGTIPGRAALGELSALFGSMLPAAAWTLSFDRSSAKTKSSA
jgi:hypothetical protein